MDRFAEVCDQVAAWASRLRKVALVADYLRSVDDERLPHAVHFLCGRPFAEIDPRRLSVGGATIRKAIEEATGWDEETVRACLRDVGDAGETVALLLAKVADRRPLDILEAAKLYEDLAECRKAQEKMQILVDAFCQYRPKALKYFVKVITGDLRIGLQKKLVEEAIAQATGQPLEKVRRANNCSGDLGEVALLARYRRLEEAQVRLFHPMEFMLAEPLETLEEIEQPQEWLIEDKLDGIRAQLHLSHGKVRLYSRGMEDITNTFPELVKAAQGLKVTAVLDGEIVGWKDGALLPFTYFQQRLARKKVSWDMLVEVPAAFFAFDILLYEGELLFDHPIESRRSFLAQVLQGNWFNLYVLPQRSCLTVEAIEQEFHRAIERGAEGLVLKRRGSTYEAGKRSDAWRKYKKPLATLDVVVTAAEQGHGKRAGVLSDYTFAVKAPGSLVNIGKAYSGLTDEEIEELTRLFRSITLQRVGRLHLVEPRVVLEVAFDSVQKSSRHRSGFALRFPRIVRWRRDKRPEEIDTLDRVREIYEQQLKRSPGRQKAETPIQGQLALWPENE